MYEPDDVARKLLGYFYWKHLSDSMGHVKIIEINTINVSKWQ